MDELSKKKEYFITLAIIASLKGTCPRRKVGAVLVDENWRILSTGYNGAPPKMTHCFGDGCTAVNGLCCNTIHAEINCIISAKSKGSYLFCTDTPCINCLKAIISHNPNMVVYYLRDYVDEIRNHFLSLHGYPASCSFRLEKLNVTDEMRLVLKDEILSKF